MPAADRENLQQKIEMMERAEREYRDLTGFLSLYCGDGLLAEELSQEVMIRVCRDWTKVRSMENPRAWCRRVGINVANSRFRRTVAERRRAGQSPTG